MLVRLLCIRVALVLRTVADVLLQNSEKCIPTTQSFVDGGDGHCSRVLSSIVRASQKKSVFFN